MRVCQDHFSFGKTSPSYRFYPADKVDLMMFYTNESLYDDEDNIANSTQMKEKLVEGVGKVNQALLNSGIEDVEVVLVHTQMVSGIPE